MTETRPRRGGDRRIIVAITGATGAVYGVRLLGRLGAVPGVETHLVMSDAAGLTLHQEVGLQRRDVESLAHVVHKNREIGATIASGSFQTDGMVIAPCSMKTLAAVAHGLADNLVARAADVVLKERRRLILMVREKMPHTVGGHVSGHGSETNHFASHQQHHEPAVGIHRRQSLRHRWGFPRTG